MGIILALLFLYVELYFNLIPKIKQQTNGLQGPPGPQGIAGPQGKKGDTGLQGETGPQGEHGPQGPRGEDGIDGENGDTGPQGEQGDIGPQGPQPELLYSFTHFENTIDLVPDFGDLVRFANFVVQNLSPTLTCSYNEDSRRFMLTSPKKVQVEVVFGRSIITKDASVEYDIVAPGEILQYSTPGFVETSLSEYSNSMFAVALIEVDGTLEFGIRIRGSVNSPVFGVLGFLLIKQLN